MGPLIPRHGQKIATFHCANTVERQNLLNDLPPPKKGPVCFWPCTLEYNSPKKNDMEAANELNRISSFKRSKCEFLGVNGVQ